MENAIRKIENEINELKEFSNKHFNSERASTQFVFSWLTRIGNLIDKLYSNTSQLRKNYSENLAIIQHEYEIHFQINPILLFPIQGILDVIFNDVKNGLINDTKLLLRAEIFSDFIEMAEYLLKEGYKDASAIILGSVLEDSLRKLSKANGIEVYKQNGIDYKMIDALNIGLANIEVYNKLVQKQITSWADLRNKAAHGNRDSYDADAVGGMLLFVKQFTEKYLS